ncbi:MAG: restriction endonuclease subunit S, partial [Candidatus Woesearchaeota archaeon]
LSTVDEAIEKTDQIIEKSKKLKKGLMQDLLTKGIGHTEFKKVQLGPKEIEIPENWKIKKLKKISKIKSGGTPKTKNEDYWNGEILWVTPTDITNNNSKYISDSNRKITAKGLKKSSAILLNPGAVLMTSRATIGEASINTKPMATNQGFKSIVCCENLNNEYFYYYIPIIRSYLEALGGGSTFLEISKRDVGNLKIPLPPLPEQEKIAEILSSVDERIEKEQEYKEKLQELKKGLMQDLLTGKVRVNNLINN